MTKEVKLTEMEEKVLGAIMEDNFYENGFDSLVWTDYFIETVECVTGIEPKKTRALLVTLKKKGFMGVEGGKNGCTWLEERGKKWLLGRDLVDERGFKKI